MTNFFLANAFLRKCNHDLWQQFFQQFVQLPIEYNLLIKIDDVASQLSSCTLQNMCEFFHSVSHHMHNSPFNCQ